MDLIKMEEFMNKVVIITGGTRGIGRESAIKFASNNYDIALNYLKSDNLARELKDYLESTYNVKVLLIKGDISKEDMVINMVDKVINTFNRIDVLVNNAGIAIDSTIDDKSILDFKKVIDTNLIGTYLMSKYVSKYMLNNKCGSIINVSSTNGIDTYYPYSIDYDASKAGVISLTHNFSKLLSPFINVNCVAPGWVDTDMNRELDSNQIEEEESKILLGRFAKAEEIANVIYFLSTSNASYINNAVIRVDGGISN